MEGVVSLGRLSAGDFSGNHRPAVRREEWPNEVELTK
jgi:hypothetical protein